MYIYVHYETDRPNGLAFHKLETAVEYVVEKIEENIGVREKKAPIKAEQPKKKKAPYSNRFTIPAPAIQQMDVLMGDNPIGRPVPVHNDHDNDDNDDFAAQPIQLNVPSPRYTHHFLELKSMLDKAVSPVKDADPKYLLAVKEQIAITNANKTIENAQKLIEQFDMYMKNSCGIECPLHTIQEIGIADAKV